MGAQWRNRLASIKEAAEKSPKFGTHSTCMNVRLHKC
ncbi:hypothetical protein [Pseudomonas sp. BP7]